MQKICHPRMMRYISVIKNWHISLHEKKLKFVFCTFLLIGRISLNIGRGQNKQDELQFLSASCQLKI
jgi:hypothetical protein